MKFQPIETAPRDRRILLARVAKYGFCGVADGYYYTNHDGACQGWIWPYNTEPTHWAPMPVIENDRE